MPEAVAGVTVHVIPETAYDSRPRLVRLAAGSINNRALQALKWVRPAMLRTYPMPPADEPLIPALIDLL